MNETQSRRYVAATVVAVGLAIVGTSLPWVQKLPVISAEDTPEAIGAAYTLELIPQLEAGITSFDLFVLAPALLAFVAGVVAASRGRRWWMDGVLATMGGVMLWVAGESYIVYYTTERYAAQPGVYLVLAAGLLLVLIGVSGFLTGLTSGRTGQAAT